MNNCVDGISTRTPPHSAQNKRSGRCSEIDDWAV